MENKFNAEFELIFQQIQEDYKNETQSKEKSLNRLVEAGIVDKNGHFTKPYKKLEQIFRD